LEDRGIFKFKTIREIIMKRIVLQATMLSGMLFLGLAGTSSSPIEIIKFTGNEVFIPQQLGNIKLFKDACGFHVFKDGVVYDVSYYFCPADELTQSLFKMSNYQLKRFLGRDKPKMIALTPEQFSRLNLSEMVEVTGAKKDKLLNQLFGGSSGYIGVGQLDNGEYILRAKMRLLGGVDLLKILVCGGLVVFGVFTAGVGLAGIALVGAAAGVVEGVMVGSVTLTLAGAGGRVAVGGIQELAAELETNNMANPTTHQPEAHQTNSVASNLASTTQATNYDNTENPAPTALSDDGEDDWLPIKD